MANYKVFSFDKIPSTQTYAHDMIASGRAADHTAIVAAAQSAGRGRRQHTWVSHHGNLYVSFIYSCPRPDSRLAYSVAVAVAETLIGFGMRPEIKWPNDILLDGKKISGILIEYSEQFVIVGIGINIKSNPTVADYETTRVDRYADVSSTDVLGALMRNMDIWMAADFRAVRARWTELAAGLNKTVVYRGAPAELVGIDENGALILHRDGEKIQVYGDEITM